MNRKNLVAIGQLIHRLHGQRNLILAILDNELNLAAMNTAFGIRFIE